MRICYISNAASIHTRRWVNYFVQRGHEVHLISPELREGYQGYDKRIVFHPLTRLLPQVWKVSRYPSGILWFFQIRRLLKKIKPDILDAHAITVNGYLGVASGFHPLILSAWGSDILIDAKQNPLWRALTKYALRKAELVVCDSETVKKELLRMGMNPGRIRKIYNGIDTQQFNSRQRDGGLKARLGIERAPMVICIRSLRAIYNVEMLLKAIPSVLAQMPGVRFVIGGDGEQRDYLKNLAESLGISESIRFVGWIPHDELPQYLASSDVYVSTSVSDSTSLSLQEAMACELVPVVTAIPANREWVTDGKNGFIVPLNDFQTLAQKIVYLLRNQVVRRKFGKLGREIIQERAEYEEEMGKVGTIYWDLVGK